MVSGGTPVFQVEQHIDRRLQAAAQIAQVLVLGFVDLIESAAPSSPWNETSVF